MVLIVFSGIMTLPRLFEFNMKERPPIEIYSSSSKEDRHVNQCMLYNVTLLRPPYFIRDANISCHIVCGCKPAWNDQQLYRFWYHIVVEASVKFIFPFLLLLGFNVGIIRNLIHSYKFQKRMMRAKPQSQPGTSNKTKHSRPKNTHHIFPSSFSWIQTAKAKWIVGHPWQIVPLLSFGSSTFPPWQSCWAFSFAGWLRHLVSRIRKETFKHPFVTWCLKCLKISFQTSGGHTQPSYRSWRCSVFTPKQIDVHR